ncbi:uncharacterized protein [Musca autumnalis]|uniref:uncharacterized protein n=1 Tax=Musca autumnalis TaxID=221902 RepID=UPI003CF50B79
MMQDTNNGVVRRSQRLLGKRRLIQSVPDLHFIQNVEISNNRNNSINIAPTKRTKYEKVSTALLLPTNTYRLRSYSEIQCDKSNEKENRRKTPPTSNKCIGCNDKKPHLKETNTLTPLINRTLKQIEDKNLISSGKPSTPKSSSSFSSERKNDKSAAIREKRKRIKSHSTGDDVPLDLLHNKSKVSLVKTSTVKCRQDMSSLVTAKTKGSKPNNETYRNPKIMVTVNNKYMKRAVKQIF